MVISDTQVYNLEGAVRGVRNPLASWDKSDSRYYDEVGNFVIGPKDLDLMKRLCGGSEERKFLRQILVCMDVEASLFWWKEFSTYKIGTTANSTSTMHKLASTPITIDCFEIDDYEKDLKVRDSQHLDTFIHDYINGLEELRKKYLETKDKKYWKELVRWLPEGWLQRRTITLNYEVLLRQYFQRKNHKLTEWHIYCDWIKTLPYMDEFIKEFERRGIR